MACCSNNTGDVRIPEEGKVVIDPTSPAQDPPNTMNPKNHVEEKPIADVDVDVDVYKIDDGHSNKGRDDENFARINGYDWDMAIIFPVESRESLAKAGKSVRDMMVHKLHKAGIETYMYLSAQKDEVICKLRCPLTRLQQFADQIDFKMLMEEKELQKFCENAPPYPGIGPIQIAHDPTITKIQPYQFIYGKYENELDSKMYHFEGKLSHPFHQMLRIKLIVLIMEARENQGGCGLSCSKLLEKKDMLAFFPLHNDETREHLKNVWTPGKPRWPGKQPLDEIKSYFGEKIGVYFAFMGHYTSWLFVLGVAGIGVTIYDYLAETVSNTVTPFFSIFVVMWAVLMLEFWKRKEVTLSMNWGMTEFEEEEQDRPEFSGQAITSFVDGKPMLYFPKGKKSCISSVGQSVVWTLIFVVVAAVATIFVFKNIMKSSDNDFFAEYYSYIAAFANSIQISIFNVIYSKISVKLNDWENHRTETEYEDSLIAKTFMFQFVNSYSTFYYTAFFKKHFEGCDYGYMDAYGSCMYDLAISLGTIFCTRVMTAQISGILVPYIKAKMRERSELKGTEGLELSVAEKEYVLEPFDKMKTTLGWYAEASIQFGYVTLFVAAFPPAPFMAFLANYIVIGVYSRGLLYRYQRAMPSGAEDIGTWQSIFTVISVIAVMTNAGIVTFTTGLLQSKLGWSEYNALWVFVVSQYVVFLFMALFAYWVPDVPEVVNIQLQRTSFITSKVIDKLPDEEEDPDQALFTPTGEGDDINEFDDGTRSGGSLNMV